MNAFTRTIATARSCGRMIFRGVGLNERLYLWHCQCSKLRSGHLPRRNRRGLIEVISLKVFTCPMMAIFRGVIAAASLKFLIDHVVCECPSNLPRRNRRGLIEGHRY